jgi:hypothetical protein
VNYTADELERRLFIENDAEGRRELVRLLETASWFESAESLIDAYPIAARLHPEEIERLIYEAD